MREINPQYEPRSGAITNNTELSIRKDSRKRFLEFHLALGGMLLYRAQYDTLAYILQYTQSQPPKYPLLLTGMNDVFSWFKHFNDDEIKGYFIENRYPFPELDNLGVSSQIPYWICCYIVILFIRQFARHSTYMYESFTNMPKLPSEIYEIRNMLEMLDFFDKCLKDIYKNSNLMKVFYNELGLEKENPKLASFVTSLKGVLSEKLKQRKKSVEMSQARIDRYYISTKRIIVSAFDEYKELYTTNSGSLGKNDLSVRIGGRSIIMNKAAFVEEEGIAYNYDSVCAELIVDSNIRRLIPYSYYLAKTKQYLLNKSNIVDGLAKILSNKDEFIIVGINVNTEIIGIVNSSEYGKYLRCVSSTAPEMIDVFYVLRNHDRPILTYVDLLSDKPEWINMKLLNNDMFLYATVSEYQHDSQSVQKTTRPNNDNGGSEEKVLLTVAFSGVLNWRNERNVIEINMYSEYREQGVQSDINDVEAI